MRKHLFSPPAQLRIWIKRVVLQAKYTRATPGGGVLTWEESKSHLALFAVTSSPLFLSNDMCATSAPAAPRRRSTAQRFAAQH